MKEIINFAFDFFGHVIPGILVIGACSLFFYDIDSIGTIISFSQEISMGIILVLLFTSYIVGFSIDPIGKFLYKKIGLKIFRMNIEKDIDMFISDKYVLIREFSPANFKYVEKWNAYCTMSHNFSVACAFLSILSIFKIYQGQNSSFFWITALIISVLLFGVFLYRAVLFSIWAANDINATISMLDSQKKRQGNKETSSDNEEETT